MGSNVAVAITPEAPPSAAVAQGLNPQSGDPGKQASIREAWSAVVAAKGPVTYPDQNPAATDPAHVERDDTAEPSEEPKPAKTEKKLRQEEPEPEPEEEEKPEKKPEPEEEEKTDPATKVTPRDLIKERQKLRERFERNEQAQANRWRAEAHRINSAGAKLAPLVRAANAIEAGDFDGIAKSLGEFLGNVEVQDWNTLNSEALKATQSPVYKKMRDLERRQAEDAHERARREQQQTQAYQEQQRSHEIANWKRGISSELSTDDDPAIPAMLEARPELVHSLFTIQNTHYQETRGDVLPPRKAAEKLLKDIFADLKFWSDFRDEHADSEIVKMLAGHQAAPKKKPAVTTGHQRTETSEKRAPATRPASKNVSQSQTAQASAIGQMSDAEKIKLAAIKMQQDFDRIR